MFSVKWCGAGVNKLFTGGDKIIHAFDVQQNKEIGVREGYNPAKKDEDWYHTDFIMDLLPIPECGLLASGGLDSKICLWRMDNLQPKEPLKGHSLGVYSLDWYADLSLILSAGLNHNVYIWNPRVTTQISHLKGHNHSLVGVKWMKGTNQIISADISGMFRVWDVRTFTTVQTFNVPNMNEINCLAVTQSPKRIIAGGKKLAFYDYDEPTDHHLADDQACLCVLYNPVFYTFITAHPRCIKVWDASNGCLQSVFRDITSRDITCMCLDARNRKLFVGDQRGRTYSVDVKNGVKLKKFKKDKSKEREKDDISSLIYWDEAASAINNLIVASWDGKIRLYDDKDPHREGTIRNTIDRHKKEVNFVDFRLEQRDKSTASDAITASASDDGTIILYNHNSHRLESVLQPDMEPGETTLPKVQICKFLKGHQCLVSADEDGYLNFYSVAGYNEIKGKLLCRTIEYNDQEQIQISSDGTKGNRVAFPFRGIDFDADQKILYTGDEMGYMQQWDLSQLLDKLQDLCAHLHQIKETEKKASGNESAKSGNMPDSSTFLTGINSDRFNFSEDDVKKIKSWRAHTDAINWITFTPELQTIASCSFDCNVYIWNPQCEKVGSLVLGNRAVPADTDNDFMHRRYKNNWKIKIDKRTRFLEELEEAR